MWELIESNKRRSVVLFVTMGISLVLLGYFVGAVFLPPNGGIAGIFVGLGLWFLLSLIGYFSGDSVILTVSGAKEVSHDVHPRLFNIVEEMRIAAGLPARPRVCIIDDPAPNAFATGTRVERSTVAVTAGLLSKLNRSELEGVIAHEMSHIVNRDVLFVTLAGVMLGTIVIISEVFLRGVFVRSRSSKRYRAGTSGGGQALAIVLVVAILLAILAPIFARLFYFAISRRREYLADASAVRLTRYPEGLASALEKLSSVNLDLATANKVTAPMYIVNPLKKTGMRISDLTNTHPPISERIRILRTMTYGAGYSDYQKAFSNVTGEVAAIIPRSGLRETEVLKLRQPPIEEEELGRKKEMREFGDLMRAVNRYAFLTCPCGLKIKVPPDFRRATVACPRCGREMGVPPAEQAPVAAAKESRIGAEGQVAGKETAPSRPQTYFRKGSGWESFRCSCGRVLQISPAFQGSHIVCSVCGQETEIKGQESASLSAHGQG